MIFEQVAQGYRNLWSRATIRPERVATVLARIRRLVANKARYQVIEAKTGVPWWWVAVAHNLESGGRFDTYLGNGQALSERTTIEPIGRGPFATFEAGALDAIRLKKLDKLKAWPVERALYEWERYNGFGYVSRRINSPYIWSMTPLYTCGKFIEDHVYRADAVSDQVGCAAMLLGLIQLGEVSFEKENAMADLASSISPFAWIAPHLVRVIAGPLPSLAVRALAEAFSVEPDTAPIKAKLEETPLSELVSALQRAEELVQMLSPPEPAAPPVRAEEPVAAVEAAPAATPTATPGPVVVQPVKPEPSKLDELTGGWLTGWKTVGGIVIYCAAHIAGTLGYIDAATAEAIGTAGAGLAGVGVISKIERWLPLFAGFLRIKKALT